MLEKLDTIPWHALQHAYGEASEIPSLIRNLASSEKELRQAAFSRLSYTVYHQGTVYSSTAYIVPFLCTLLEDEQVEDKIRLIDFLVTIAHGSSYLDVHVHDKKKRISSEFQRKLAEELSWVQRTKEAVSEGYLTYMYLLAAKRTEIRAYAAHILACCRSHKNEVILPLRKHLTQEKNQLVYASIVLSLGQLMSWNEQNQSFFIETLHKQTQPLLKVATAIACTFSAREATPQEVVQILIESYELPQSVKDEISALPFAEFDMDTSVSNALRSVGLSIAPLVVPTLKCALERSNAWNALVLVHNLLYFALEGKIISNQMTAADLTEMQREVLSAIIESEEVWGFGNMEFTVGDFFEPQYGLDFSMRSRNDIAIFLRHFE